MSAGGNYLRKVLEIASAVEPGTGLLLTVLHDDWCGYWTGQRCDCDPEIVRRPLEATP